MARVHEGAWRAMYIALCVSLILILTACSANEQSGAIPTPTHLPNELIEYKGESYVLRNDLSTFLILGLDKFERDENSIGYLNSLQSDFILLVILDETTNECRFLHLNRDTMTEIRRLGVGGGAAGSFIGQLALAHTYGSGGSDSCINASKAVSKLLYGAEIDHYITLTMDAVGMINDLLGGVTVTVHDDFSNIDPEFKLGEEITLHGEQALKYVRSRQSMENSTNLARMERQRQYISAFYLKLMECCEQDESFMAKTIMKVSDFFVSDCSVTELDRLSDKLKDAVLYPIEYIGGEAIVGENYMEFYPDEEDLKEKVVTLLCEKIS